MFYVINLLDDVEKVLVDMFSCNKILSTSLHGIIVAQAYGIPALWCNFNSKEKLEEDNVKYRYIFLLLIYRNMNQYPLII